MSLDLLLVDPNDKRISSIAEDNSEDFVVFVIFERSYQKD